MRTYEKIETVFNRDVDGTKRLIFGDFRNETVKFLKDNVWQFTEKIDGTNIRVMWDGHKITFGGRTERANIPAYLMNYLNEKFINVETEELFEQTFGEKEVILFGEGYGAKIQGVGASYRPDVSFILFDVLIGDNYQPRDRVEDIAKMFDLEIVPIVYTGTIDGAIDYVRSNPKSTIGEAMMEGVVGRPLVEMKDRCGNRMIVKIKYNDFKEFA